MRISDWSSDVCSSDLENHYTVVDRFPFAYARSTDHLTGREDAILKRPDTDPLVIHTDSASEYWHRRASLVVTDTHGRDLALPETVRVRSEEHTSELQSLMRISYAVFCLKNTIESIQHALT